MTPNEMRQRRASTESNTQWLVCAEICERLDDILSRLPLSESGIARERLREIATKAARR